MPDITMCNGVDCPLKETCYRFKAMKKVYGQSYFLSPPQKNGKCEYYWKVDNKEQSWLSIEDKRGGGDGNNEIN